MRPVDRPLRVMTPGQDEYVEHPLRQGGPKYPMTKIPPGSL